MKLLLSESTPGMGEDIVRKLNSAGIDADIRKRTPSLFDSENPPPNHELIEVWILNNEDFDQANAILYPPEEPQPDQEEDKE